MHFRQKTKTKTKSKIAAKINTGLGLGQSPLPGFRMPPGSCQSCDSDTETQDSPSELNRVGHVC